MQLISVPRAQTQPDQPRYGVDALKLFIAFTRMTYFQTYGVEAPAYDPSRPLKPWFDSTVNLKAPKQPKVYTVVNEKGEIDYLTITNAEAAAVNLPGRESFQAFAVKATAAVQINSINGVRSQVDARSLLTYEEAQMLASEIISDLGTSVQIIGEPGVGIPLEGVIWPVDEARKVYGISVNGVQHIGGALLYERYRAGGVGCPGYWTPDLKFIYEPLPDGAGFFPQPMPVRELLENEELYKGPFGVEVRRTDKAAQAAEAGGSFTVTDRAMLQRIAAKLGV